MIVDARPHSENPDITLLTVSGRLDSASEEAASQQLYQAAAASGLGVIVNLARVEFISSAGLRVLVQTYKNLTAAGKTLAMVHAQPSVYKILKLAALDRTLNLHEDDGSALETFRKQS